MCALLNFVPLCDSTEEQMGYLGVRGVPLPSIPRGSEPVVAWRGDIW